MPDQDATSAPWWRRVLCALHLCGGGYEHVGCNVYRCRYCGGRSLGEQEDYRWNQ